MTANKREDKVWKVLADSGSTFQAYALPYLVVTSVIMAKETPELVDISATISNADEVIVELDGPNGRAKMPVSIVLIIQAEQVLATLQ